MINIDLSGKTALVTGGSRGIGSEIVRTLSQAGARVAFCASSEETATKAATEFKEAGFDVFAYWGDQSVKTEAEKIVAAAHQDLGRIDILINNAGITRDNLILRLSDEDWAKVIDTNLTGVFYITRQVVKIMVKQRYGRVVSLSSVVGFSGNPGQANYAATKAALVAFNKSLAQELSVRNINFNTVAPGFIETDMTKDLPAAVKDNFKSKIPLQRMGKASDIAGGVLFLCSDLANYITGTTLHINGGIY